MECLRLETPKEASENPETQQQTEVNKQIEVLQSNIEAVKLSIDGKFCTSYTVYRHY